MFSEELVKKLSYAVVFFSSKPKALNYGERHVVQHESLRENRLLRLLWLCWQYRCAPGTVETVGMERISECSWSKDGQRQIWTGKREMKKDHCRARA